MELRRVCVYAGSAPGGRPACAAAAAALARRGIGMVFGGGALFEVGEGRREDAPAAGAG